MTCLRANVALLAPENHYRWAIFEREIADSPRSVGNCTDAMDYERAHHWCTRPEELENVWRLLSPGRQSAQLNRGQDCQKVRILFKIGEVERVFRKEGIQCGSLLGEHQIQV